jgi:hypothetical protein
MAYIGVRHKIKLEPETIQMIESEMARIPEKYQYKFNSVHEGLCVLQEEFEELKAEVFFGEKAVRKSLTPTTDPKLKGMDEFVVEEVHRERMRDEAIQVAAMAIRFIQELT